MTRLSDRYLDGMILTCVSAAAFGFLLINSDFSAFGALLLLGFAVLLMAVGLQHYQYRRKVFGTVLSFLGALFGLMLPLFFWAVST